MYKPYLIPVSVKCIVFESGKVWLRKNQRNEWELPGGKLDKSEQPEQTAAREALEELGVEVLTGKLLDATMHTIFDSIDEAEGVLILAYLCEFKRRVGEVEHEGEAGKAEFKAFGLEEIEALEIPIFYKNWIKRAVNEGS